MIWLTDLIRDGSVVQTEKKSLSISKREKIGVRAVTIINIRE